MIKLTRWLVRGFDRKETVMEEDTVELRMAKLVETLRVMAAEKRRESEDSLLKADMMDRCATQIAVELHKAPPPTEHPANADLHLRETRP